MPAAMETPAILFKLLLLLILSPPAADNPLKDAVRPPLRGYVARPAPLYVEADINALRRLILSDSKLPDALADLQFEGLEPRGKSDKGEKLPIPTYLKVLTTQLSAQLGLEPQLMETSLAEVRRAGFWLLNYDERVDNWQYLLAIDRGPNAADILPALAKGLAGRIEFSLTKVMEIPVYSMALDDMQICFTEQKGIIAVASDPFILQMFLERSRQARSIPDGQRDALTSSPGAIVQAVVMGGPLFSNISRTLTGRARRDFLAQSELFDFPSWRLLTASYDGRRIEAALEFEPGSRFEPILPGPDKPSPLLELISASSDVAVLIGLRDPREIWKAIDGVSKNIEALTGQKEFTETIRQEIFDSTRLDIERDLLNNIVSAAFVLARAQSEEGFMPSPAFLFEVRDSLQAEISLRALIEKPKGPKENEPLVIGMRKAKIWRLEGYRFALMDRLAIMAPDTAEYNRMFNRLSSTAPPRPDDPFLSDVLPERYPTATSFAHFNPTALLPGLPLKSVSAGIWYEEKERRLRAQADVDALHIVREMMAELDRQRQDTETVKSQSQEEREKRRAEDLERRLKAAQERMRTEREER